MPSSWTDRTVAGLRGAAGTASGVLRALGPVTTAPDDYDRACAVDGPAGVIAVGQNGAQALVLADEPATSCFLPEHRAFLRWLAADSEAGLKAAARAVLADPATEWEECGTWSSDEPVTLMDSAEAGSALDTEYPGGGRPSQASATLPACRPLEGPSHPYQGGRRVRSLAARKVVRGLSKTAPMP
ncbi:Imm21 family immunity protein [Streptomyces anulatus]|uniref:Imm21 family immunity protein n=1 Tax=Streptomyces anulatus TaxID=1892 RepID=UPI00363D6742